MLGAGRGIALVDRDEVVATAIALPYGAVGWLSMILVRDDRRGLGLAARVVERGIALLRASGSVPVLDATPAGREVYLRKGFIDTWPAKRLRASGERRYTPAIPDGVTLRAYDDRDAAAVAALDEAALAANRAPVLRALAARFPTAALVAERSGRCIGFALARNGRTATHVGPVICDDPAIGGALLARALDAVPGPAIVDVPDAHAALQAELLAGGFAVERPFTRMVCGDPARIAPPGPIAAIAGPELG